MCLRVDPRFYQLALFLLLLSGPVMAANQWLSQLPMEVMLPDRLDEGQLPVVSIGSASMGNDRLYQIMEKEGNIKDYSSLHFYVTSQGEVPICDYGHCVGDKVLIHPTHKMFWGIPKMNKKILCDDGTIRGISEYSGYISYLIECQSTPQKQFFKRVAPEQILNKNPDYPAKANADIPFKIGQEIFKRGRKMQIVALGYEEMDGKGYRGIRSIQAALEETRRDHWYSLKFNKKVIALYDISSVSDKIMERIQKAIF